MTRVKLLSTREVAETKGLTQRQVQRLAKAGVIRPAAFGPRNTQFFKASDVRYMKTSLKAL